MSADTWETGPQFTIAKADQALAASGEALYAMGGDNNSAGFFDATASVHRLDLGDWPSGAWEDLGDPLPSPRSGNQAGFCTTAKAGGEIYSVGGFAGFVWTNANVHRETGEGCGGASDVTWLTADPAEGSIEPGGDTTVAVAVDASVPEVDQPGAYLADLVVSGAGADAISVPVTMNVAVPDNFGKATGTIVGLARCDAPGAPLEGATVQIGDFTVETDETGLYEWWLAEGTYPITITADGYVSQSGEVMITAGDTTESSFDLRLDAPCRDGVAGGHRAHRSVGRVGQHRVDVRQPRPRRIQLRGLRDTVRRGPNGGARSRRDCRFLGAGGDRPALGPVDRGPGQAQPLRRCRGATVVRRCRSPRWARALRARPVRR